MDMYREDVMDHYEHPRNQGSFGDAQDKDVLTARDSNASCGDMVKFYIRIAKGKIIEVKWEGIGCAITTAAASKLSEYLQGQSLKVVQKMSEEELVRKGVGFEVNPGRSKCLMLPVIVVGKILKN